MSKLKPDPYISFIAGLVISALIIGVVWLCFFIMIFDLGGGETLTRIDNQNIAQLVFAIFLLIMAVIYSLRFIKSNKRYTAYGIITPALIIFLAAAFYFLDQNIYRTGFNRIAWERSEYKPERMAKTLVREKSLIGFTRMQVKEMLGETAAEYGDKNTDRGSLIYRVENHWTLSVLFQYDKVVEVTLRLPFLGI